MRRDLETLANGSFDLVVVGGGIHGVCSAWDAAQRGLSVALLERGDFCGATSSNSLKTVHGGLRYLQQADVARMRISIRERRSLLRLAPHLVRPLPFVMPTRRRLTRSRLALRVALRLNDWIGFDRNRDLGPAHRLPDGRLLSRAECLAFLPGLEDPGITGGALWYDAQIRSPERLCFAYLHRAAAEGAQAAHYVEVTRLLDDQGRVAGVHARDLLGGEEMEVRGRMVLNTAGPWVERLLETRPDLAQRDLRLSKAMNLVVKKPLVHDHAIGIGDGGDRLLFLVPWRGLTMIGTTHQRYDGEPDDARVTGRDIEEFLADVHRAYPAAALEPDDVLFFHGGLLPITKTDRAGEATLLKRHRILDHARTHGVDGLVSVVAVKWTTSRAVAEQAVDLVFSKLGKPKAPCRTAETPVHGGERADRDALEAEIRSAAGLAEDEAAHLAGYYGAAYVDLLPCLREEPGRLSPATPVQRAEVLHAVREEMARTLSDVVFRRTELGTAGPPDADALAECARLAAKELRWDEPRTEREVAEVTARYVPAET